MSDSLFETLEEIEAAQKCYAQSPRRYFIKSK